MTREHPPEDVPTLPPAGRTNMTARLPKPNEVVSVYRVRRDVEDGLSFYRNHETSINYEQDGMPSGEHILITREKCMQAQLHSLAGGPILPAVFPMHRAQNFACISGGQA